MKRCALVSVKDQPGLFAVLTPEAASYLTHIHAEVIVDHARELHYLTMARKKLSISLRDPAARLVQLGVDQDSRIICVSDDP